MAMGHKPIHHSPEMWAMIHMQAVRHFMGRHIIADQRRGQNQPPIKAQIACRRAASPAADGIAHPHPPQFNIKTAGMLAGLRGQMILGHGP